MASNFNNINPGLVIVDYTPPYDSWGWKGDLHVEYDLSTDQFKYSNGRFGRWNLTDEQIVRIKNFLKNKNNLLDFFDDSKAYSCHTNNVVIEDVFGKKQSLNPQNFVHGDRSYTLHFQWNGMDKTIEVGMGCDIPFKHPF